MARPRKALEQITNTLPSLVSESKPPTHASQQTPRTSESPSGRMEEEVMTPAETVATDVDNSVPMYVVPVTEVPEDIDQTDMDNPFTCSPYANDAYQYLMLIQGKLRPNPRYMAMQPQLNARIRTYCIDWAVDLHRLLSQTYQTSLQADTLFITISIFDRFLSRKVVSYEKVYLLMLSCFFVASKFEETYYPSIEQLLKFCPEVGTKDELLKMERIILNELRYSLGAPTALTFLKRFAKAAHADSTVGMIARFIAEYSLTSYSLTTTYLPSQIAAASISHALRITGRPPWSATLQHYTMMSYEDLLPILRELKETVKKAPIQKTHAIFTKYSAIKYLRAATIAVANI
ncbi:putative G2/mitotic-specific cyclin-B [Monocercomonoides exilis]|uniref:putative G2/mitotic-specific cyclin-B n=1 Tax=Monocercomonoides exilis TaxID=2049356 RepID=UPI003559D4FF|nr:putative G2/mitotic-specific cyclin-B [Monocercomonoides exilis]|eukprot:MONOS_13012.1-p1 / transcript=MONOS_13012.1 / gene=MONOS_13012 / organism=Monocercomonoides_exilis_PA203 / gene_product=unspecified product / transcript_product=unspecified product / location=Mono_scaffold00766:15798-16978(-) / protein_length=346 / sequence_SO=supercontig / SO=protein_coding / is_pseudo=false